MVLIHKQCRLLIVNIKIQKLDENERFHLKYIILNGGTRQRKKT